MTIEELSQLSDEELRVKVAEKMGWKIVKPKMGAFEYGFEVQNPEGRSVYSDSELPYWPKHILPPYSTSLDAIHEAEKTLSDANLAAMMRILYWMLIPEKDQYPDHFLVFKMVAKIATATARQRAIAFLLV